MLLELTIEDFAIIDRATIEFGPGMNAITGETGSGKSILLDALAAVLGSTVSADLVRTGAKSARLEAVFSVDGLIPESLADALAAAGVALDDDRTLILGREIQQSGRSMARVNGRTTTATQLGRIGATLVDIHGQSDHLAILKADEQRSLLDRYAQATHERSEVARLARRLRSVRSQLSDLLSDSQERERRLDLLRFQADEIEAAALGADEDVALASERDVLLNADRLREDSGRALVDLIGDDSLDVDRNAASCLRAVERAVTDLSDVDHGATEMLERATELVVLAEDLGRELRSYLERVEADPHRLDEVEERLSEIQSLKRKYGGTIAEIVAFGAAARGEIEESTSGSLSVEALEADRSATENDLILIASALSRKREDAAVELGRKIEESVADLRMGRASVTIDVRRRSDKSGIDLEEHGVVSTVHFDETGIDDVEFLIAPNAGEALKPLARIASGGETARIMLAVKSILSEIDTTPTLVFDEIDVGVGGRSGQVVGEKLMDVSRLHQVIVVTHLPQIAAHAGEHFQIFKEERGDRTVSGIRSLDGDARIEELAAMLDGVPVSDAAITSAREMIERSRANARAGAPS